MRSINPRGPVLITDADTFYRSFDCIPEPVGDDVLGSSVRDYIGPAYLDQVDANILGHLCRIADIDEGYVRSRTAIIGAQYLMAHLFDEAFWTRIELKCIEMYQFLKTYPCRYHHVQEWTASMWAILYELYRREKRGECCVFACNPLSFAWPTDAAHVWPMRNILHMAGVTETMQPKGYFYKGAYTTKPPFDVDLSYVKPDNCSWVYAKAIQGYSKVRTIKEN